MKAIARYVEGFHGESVRVKYVFSSGNHKTGNAIQQYITPSKWENSRKIDVVQSEAVCNGCPLIDKQCYVKQGMPKLGLISTSRTTNHITASETDDKHLKKFIGRFVRFGAFGEPVLAGLEAISSIASVAYNWTGYTHQWTKQRFQWAKQYLMASVESKAAKKVANMLGWRTFRLGLSLDDILPDEVLCPASAEAGRKVQCIACGLCKGASITAKNVFIIKHK